VDSSYFKVVPSTLYPALDLIYRSACTDHNRMLNRKELEQHDIKLDLKRLSTDYQHKKKHNEVNQELRDTTIKIGSIGKRFTSRTTLDKPLPHEEPDN